MMKDEIVDLALARFLKCGIKNMTIKKLVEPLGISTKTVYKYFGSKEELLEECLELLYNGYNHEFNAILSRKDDPVSTLLILFRATLGKDFGVTHLFFHDLNFYYPEVQNAVIDRNLSTYAQLMIPLIERGKEEGYYNKYIIPEMALKGIGLLYTSITRSEDYKTFPGSPYDLFKNLVEVFIRGMCTEKGLQLIDNNPYHND